MSKLCQRSKTVGLEDHLNLGVRLISQSTLPIRRSNTNKSANLMSATSSAPGHEPSLSIIPFEKGHLLEAELVIPRPLEEVFEFFSNAHNLQKLTPDYLHFEILTPAPIKMEPGTLIDYRLRLHGVPLRWQTRIVEWQPPHHFVDEQLKGPYRYWIHQHTFEETADGTRMVDRVRYAAPWSWLTHRWFVRPDVERIFAYRTQALKAHFHLPDGAGRRA